MDAGLPDKLYLKIGEVSAFTGLPASVLRYWESEFPSLRPKKSASGQRLYTRKDVEQVVEIKTLLYGEKLTIEGAKRRIEGKRKAVAVQVPQDMLTEMIREIRDELRSLRDAISE